MGVVLCLAAVGVGSTPEASPAWSNGAGGARLQKVQDQLVRGRVAYGLKCIRCHADHPQELSDEWRSQWDPDDQDCWKSKCHSHNHPPDGLIIRRGAPPLKGEAMLAT